MPETYYHVTAYANWPAIRDKGLIPSPHGHEAVWLFDNVEQAMLYKDSYSSDGSWAKTPPTEWRVPPCIVVVRTDRAVPTDAGIPGAYWVEGTIDRSEIFDVIRPEDLHHYAGLRTATFNIQRMEVEPQRGLLKGLWLESWHLNNSAGIEAKVPDERHPIGWINWNVTDKTVSHVEVKEGYRRKGLATIMWAKAKEIEPAIRHSDWLSPDGKGWSQTVGRRTAAETLTVYRGVYLELEERDYPGLPGSIVEKVLRGGRDYSTGTSRANLGQHWTLDKRVAQKFATPMTRHGEEPTLGSDGWGVSVPVVITARVSAADAITDEAALRDAMVEGIGWVGLPSTTRLPEQEVLLRPGASISVTEIEAVSPSQWWRVRQAWENMNAGNVSKFKAEWKRIGGGLSAVAGDYRGHHRAPTGVEDVAAPFHDVEEMMPDYYGHPEWYSHDRGAVDRECLQAIRAARGKPNAMVTIYRALPPGFTSINPGDWVTPSLAYARQHAISNGEEDWPVITATVPAKTLWTEGYAAEWGYSGPTIGARTARLVERLTASAEYSDSVMVCLRPSEVTRKVFAEMDECTESVEDLHVTLFYLGTKDDCGGEWGEERLYRALYAFAVNSGYRGLTGVANGFGVFRNEQDTLVTLWDIPGIAEFRTHLGAKMHEHGVPMREENHGFTPHMTLGYSDETIAALPEIPEQVRDQKEIFGSLWLVWGEVWTEVTLP